MTIFKKPSAQKVSKIFLITIFILASLLRILYISRASIEDYQYDVGTKELRHQNEAYEKIYEQDRSNLKQYRHLDYVMTIYNTGKLPDSNKVQQYHPPLHHIICVILLKVLDHFPLSATTKLESLQILTCIYSILAMFIIMKICDEFKLNNFYKIIVLLFVGFNPLFIFMSGFISNDMLVSMLILLCFYLIIKWNKNPSYVNTILLGLVFGLGCATKTSMSVMLILIFVVVIAKWITNIIKNKKSKPKPTQSYRTTKFLLQTLIFLTIASPLSLAYPIRNNIKFNQPILYVVQPKDDLKLSNKNFINRFTPFSTEIFEKQIKEKHENIFSYAIKSDIVFGLKADYHYTILLTFIIILLYALSIFASIYLLIKAKNSNIGILIFATFLWLASFIFFNIEYPASCTMHAKYIYAYIGLLPIINACFLQKKDNYVLSMIVYTLSTLFAVFSTLGMLYIIL